MANNPIIKELYMANVNLPAIIDYTQWTNDIPWKFVFMDVPLESGQEVAIYIKKPSGNEVYNYAASKTTGIAGKASAQFNVTNQMSAEYGHNLAQVRIVKDGKVLNSFPVLVRIAKSPICQGAIVSKDEFVVLDDAIRKAKTGASSAASAAAAANAAVSRADTATSNANSATSAANQAASAAATAESNANAATKKANDAADAATKSKADADAAEALRKQAESSRVTAESQRVTEFNQMKDDVEAATGNANKATQAANAATTNANKATQDTNAAIERALQAAATLEQTSVSLGNLKIQIDPDDYGINFILGEEE